MSIMIKPYSHTLVKDAKEVLEGRTVSQQYYSIDIKKIAGYIILSTPEGWIDEGLNDMSKRQHTLQTSKIPFYTGFRSGSGLANQLESTLKASGIDYQSLEYETPYCFDDTTPMVTIGDDSILESIGSLFI